jgi:hypothetical protein
MDMGTDILDKAAQSQSQEEVQVKGDWHYDSCTSVAMFLPVEYFSVQFSVRATVCNGEHMETTGC